MMEDIYSFSSPRKLYFDTGAIRKIGPELRELGSEETFIICDPIVTEKELINPVLESLEDSAISYGIWDKTEPEPFSPSVQDALNEARDGDYDSVVGIGGGSTLDTAKMVTTILHTDNEVKDFFETSLPKRKVPFILAPTTSGTGSEVSNCTIIGDPEEDFKHALYSPDLYPDVALVDPLLTKTAPPNLTARSGCDALSHAIEAYVSCKATPITDIFAVEAIKLVNKHLRSAYSSGENMDSRLGMSRASLFAGLAFGNAGTVLGHALGYSHTYIHHSPHGLSVSVTQPYAMEYNAIADFKKFAYIAELLGENIDDLSVRDAAFKAPNAFKKLLEDLNLPSTLKDLGVTEKEVPSIAKKIFDSTAHIARNPRGLDQEKAENLVHRALIGELKP